MQDSRANQEIQGMAKDWLLVSMILALELIFACRVAIVAFPVMAEYFDRLCRVRTVAQKVCEVVGE